MKTAMDYESEEREARIPPLCPLCHRRASERSKSTFEGNLRMSVHRCSAPFHDAADYGPMLLEALKDVDAAGFAGMGNYDALIAAVEGRKEVPRG
jgi:hypothetical protein